MLSVVHILGGILTFSAQMHCVYRVFSLSTVAFVALYRLTMKIISQRAVRWWRTIRNRHCRPPSTSWAATCRSPCRLVTSLSRTAPAWTNSVRWRPAIQTIGSWWDSSAAPILSRRLTWWQPASRIQAVEFRQGSNLWCRANPVWIKTKLNKLIDF